MSLGQMAAIWKIPGIQRPAVRGRLRKIRRLAFLGPQAAGWSSRERTLQLGLAISGWPAKLRRLTFRVSRAPARQRLPAPRLSTIVHTDSQYGAVVECAGVD